MRYSLQPAFLQARGDIADVGPLDAQGRTITPTVTGDAARPALRAQELASGGVVAAFELQGSARISDTEELGEIRDGRAILRHLGLQVWTDAIGLAAVVRREEIGALGRRALSEHLSQPLGAELAADAGEGRRIPSGVAEIMVALEVRLTARRRGRPCRHVHDKRRS